MPTTQALTATETASAAAGNPCLMSANALELAEDGESHWSVNGGSFTAASAASSQGPELAFDRLGDPQTRPDVGATPTEYTLAFQIPVNTRVVDAVAILGTNFAELAALYGETLEVDVDTADASDFTTGLTEVASFTVSSTDPERLAALLPVAYVGQRWWRITIARTSGTAFSSPAAFLPAIGEVWLSKRRAMPWRPQRPYDPDATEAERDLLTLPGGQQHGVTIFQGRGRWEITYRLSQDQNGVEARETLRKWWRDSGHGGPSIWMPDSLATANRAQLVRAGDGGLAMPEVGPALQEAAFTLLEQPPFYLEETTVLGE